MDPKELLIKHVEKGVLGLCVVLAVLFAFTSLVSSGAADIDPADIDNKLASAKKRIASQSNEPPALPDPDWSADLKKLVDPIKVDTFVKWWKETGFNFMPRDRPKLLVPQDVICTPGRGLIGVYKRGSDGKIVFEEIAEKPEKRDQGGRRRRGAADVGAAIDDAGMAAGGTGAPAGGPGGDMAGAGPDMAEAGAGMAGGPGAGGRRRASARKKRVLAEEEDESRFGVDMDLLRKLEGGEGPGDDDVSSRGGRKARAKGVPVIDGKPLRWVMVSAVFPHAAQLKEFQKKLKVPEPVYYHHIQCQRREQKPDSAWTDWADVTFSIESFVEFQRELPQIRLFDGLVQPLPWLIRGTWAGKYRNEVIRAIVDARKVAQRDRANERMIAGERRAGTDVTGHTIRAGGGAATGTAAPAAAKDEKTKAREEQKVIERVRSIVEKVLVRFIDVTVEPGRIYQYRMRVWFQNPNYKLRNVVNPHLATDELIASEDNLETGETAWSKPSTPVRVPKDVYFYVVGGKKDVGTLELHSWAYGSWQVRKTESYPIGAMIGQEKKTDVVTVSGDIERRSVDFRATDNLLLDAPSYRPFTVQVSLGAMQVNTRIKDVAEVIYVAADGSLRRRLSWIDQVDGDRKQRVEDHEKLIKKATASAEADKSKEGPTPLEEISGLDAAMDDLTGGPGGGQGKGRKRRGGRGGRRGGAPGMP